MNLTEAPNTPIRTPQLRSSAKSLQLTPIWQEVVKNNRLPLDIDQDLVFDEISVRLEDLEWPVRQHAFRVLYDVIPVVPKERLDEKIARNGLLGKLILNLGHPAPGIRKVASETLQKYLKRTSRTEKMLEEFLEFGLKDKEVSSGDQIGILRENVTLGSMVALIDVLKPFIVPENGGYSLSQAFLAETLEALAEKSKNPAYREKSLEVLWKLKELVGETRFHHALDGIREREQMLNLMKGGSDWDVGNSFNVLLSQDSLEAPSLDGSGQHREVENPGKDGSSEDFSDGTDTETYTKEPAPSLDDDAVYFHASRTEPSHYAPPSFVPIEHSDNFLPRADAKEKEEQKGNGTSSPRVVLEAEIQFAKNKAITMKVMEDEKEEKKNEAEDEQRRFVSENGDLVMKVLQDEEDVEEEERTRTPRRVRFGGEVIKLRTPDSDTTDITIEIRDTGGGTAGKEPTITITPDLGEWQRTKANEGEEEKNKSQVLVAPALAKTPSREPSPSRRAEASRIPVLKECSSPKSESPDSAPSSSGSEGEVGGKWSDDEESAWKWVDLRLVEENILKDLKNKENWKIQYQALEQLKVVLINPKTIERIGKSKNEEKLVSLMSFLLNEAPRSDAPQVTALALSVVSQLIETLPKEFVLRDVEDIVRGLCRYVGGCKNLNLKIEAVQSLKMLFGILEPSEVIEVLLGESCLLSSGSKLRENSLLAIMYATMTFPSDVFQAERILEKVAASAADVRRRVRHAALEAIAVLSQFCSSQALAEAVAKAAETLPTAGARAQLVAAVQARLSRRLLPTISGEGLVLYALQIPASRRFRHFGSPMGADVDWILSGTGSVSTGSAKSKTQLIAAQRLDSKPSAPLSPNKWAQSERLAKSQTAPTRNADQEENPWKMQKNRTESSMRKLGDHQGMHKSRSSGNLNDSEGGKESESNFPNPNDSEKRLRTETVTWALIPVSALEEPLVGRERSNSLWGESLEDAPHYLSPSFGPLRPMYLKLQPTTDQLILSRSSDDLRRNSYSYVGRKKNLEDFADIRLLTPTILREKNLADNCYQNEKVEKSEVRVGGDAPTRIPVLCSNNLKNVQKTTRVGAQFGSDRLCFCCCRPRNAVSAENVIVDSGTRCLGPFKFLVPFRKISETENSLPGSQKQRLSNGSNGFPRSPAFLPSIHATHDSNYTLQKPPASNKYEDVDEMKLQETMTHLSGLLSASKSTGKPANFYSVENQPQLEATGHDNFRINESDAFDNKIQSKFFDRSYLKNHETLPNTVASAPPVISADSRDQIPSTSSSNSTDFGTLPRTELRVRRLTNGSGTLVDGSEHPYRNYSTYNPKMKGKKISQTKNSNKIGVNGNSFPDNLKPFDRPKEGLDTCFSQMESQQWEVNMLGLTSLVRLLRHHPAVVLGQLHPIIVTLGRQIRNLRSQVARVACQASAEMFLALKRNVEPDLEELTGPLFHRSADTNRFIRADCNHALDNMVDNVGHAKAVIVIISKGTTHQNATVRTVAARLLLRLSEKAGPEKLLSLPKETRDKMLQAGANLLMEGKLETRAFAKQVFRVWSSHPSFSALILEAVQPNVMRHISKTLISLKT